MTLWRASLDGMDLSPPLNTMLTHSVQAIAGDGPMSAGSPHGGVSHGAGRRLSRRATQVNV